MARIPYVEKDAAPAPVREVLERFPVELNIFRLMAHAETSFRPLLRLGASILGQQKLSARLRELAILRVARLSRAEYEWVQHVPIARAVGITPEQIAALERGDPAADCFDAEERAVLRFTAEVVRDVGCAQPTFDAVAKSLSPREIVELLLAIGYYMMVARLMETLRIDLDPPAGTRIVDQVRGS
jgi:AhpD family alkylhydroperoxidase